MYKHIRFVARPSREYLGMEVLIVEQTHRLYEFSVGPANRFKAKNGVELFSDGYPKAYSGNSLKVYLRGHVERYDNNVLKMDMEDYATFKEAVEEYNEYFKE